ncbi:hypothetical protein PV10_07905 [Exophiala mesophila]|uniref:N-acetyltransferase domain-containing protein n=1 Tax=Exophiala mesophila TaxID=212818 RepID=A0A0D1WNL6_EXOME|nr:uncharacterized protein PV10_07905 [Exophiala mesophila]KIV90620.1 hypothetical protein PV10_07905 [Exophiala mesophila]
MSGEGDIKVEARSVPSSHIEIHPITNEADIPLLASITDFALLDDGLREFHARYGQTSLYETTCRKLTNAFHDKHNRYHIFKAVLVPASNESNCEPTIVGYAQWRLGYIETPKVDPFAIKSTAINSSDHPVVIEADRSIVTLLEPAEQQSPTILQAIRQTTTSTKETLAFYSNPDEELSRKVGNAYISAIRGKRHLYLHRLIVLPSHQHQGVGQKLLDWGVQTADRENVVSWLFSRPAGSKLYTKNGWQTHCTIDIQVPHADLQVAPMIGMQRLPRHTEQLSPPALSKTC